MKKLAVMILTALAMNAYADDVTPTTTASDSNTNQMIAQIQSEINALQAQLNTKTYSGVATIGTDAANPLSAMSKVQMPIYILRAKNQLNNPVVLGGEIETDLQYTNGDSIPLKNGSSYESGSDISLSKVYLMTMANINDETTALVNLKMGLPDDNIDVERAFLIFGNLNKNPFSLMVGANYLPFGVFSGNGPWSNALTTNLFRVSTTNQVIGNFSNKWFIVNAGIYSDNKVGDTNNVDFLANALAQTTWKKIGMSFGVGYLSDVRGTNSGFGNAYSLNGTTSASQPLSGGTNGAIDINASIGPSYFTVLGEFVTTAQGATEAGQSVGQMNVWMLGEQSKFKIYDIPTVFQLSYSATKNMGAIEMTYNADIPENFKTAAGIEHQWLTSIQSQFWQNVWIGPEFVTAKLYTGQYSYTGTLDCSAYF